MKITETEYLGAVKKEIINIKTYATAGAINNLDFDTLRPHNTRKCIYGQMYGHCRRYDAVKLIQKCCYKYSIEGNQFLDLNDIVKKNKITELATNSYFSLLENYITIYPAQNKQILAYLRGEGKLPKLKTS